MWAPIVGFPDYEVSSYGRVRRVVASEHGHPPKVLTSCFDPKGYARIHLMLNGKRHSRIISRLVCQAFHGNPPSPYHQAAHGDGNKKNNRMDNLRWATRRENEADKKAHGTALTGDRHFSRRLPALVPRGQSHAMAVLTEENVREIRRRAQEGETRVALAREFGCSPSLITLVRHRRRWAHIE